ncbi:hypothetical protein [Geodermatophilus sp. CPCC 206100]|uniref:hypothetical protein n=1 Tax=Geodermatophilus sp. CPCC 206100 TaxID=3020054 RepID=UPI003B00070B
MANEGAPGRRLKFYGSNDYGTYFQMQQVGSFLAGLDLASGHWTVVDIIELYNAQQYIEQGFLPSSFSDEERKAHSALVPQMAGIIGRFFNGLTDTTLPSLVGDFPYHYHDDLLVLFARYKVYDRCGASAVLAVLDNSRINLGEMLSNQGLVRAYGQELRERLLGNPANAELLIRKHLEKDVRRDVFLPASLTSVDARQLLDAYLDSDGANPNFVELIATAPLTRELGLDAKLKLKAKRKHDRWTEDFFKGNSGIKTGVEVTIAGDQAEPVEASNEGLVTKFSYGRGWLEDNLDYPTILNNFLYLFEFADRRMLLTLPSFEAQRGVFERFMGVAGRADYPLGAAFRFKEQASLLQTVIYDHFLRDKNIELESVIAWFFADYLKDEFGATGFRFVPSSRAASYLEKCRHLFAEMESVVKQFSLYVENGELDPELLAMGSDQARFRVIPSLLDGKYVYATSAPDIQQILHLLFSDQSGLAYINEGLRADNAARLLIGNHVAYDDFENYQHRQVDYLIQHGVLVNTGERVRFADVHQFHVLKDLFECEATSYFHHPAEGRASIDAMVAKGWLERRSSLLTEAEASYFNFCLNHLEFSNGPNLRNRYSHGSHVDPRDEDEHFRTYITALKLLVALLIKMNDDFWLRADERRFKGSP